MFCLLCLVFGFSSLILQKYSYLFIKTNVFRLIVLFIYNTYISLKYQIYSRHNTEFIKYQIFS